MQNQPAFHHSATRIAGFLFVSAIALGLAACDKMKEPTAGQQLDSAVEKTERAAVDAKAQAQAAMESAKTKVEEGASKAEASAREAGGSAMAVVDDVAITAQVSAGLAQDPALSALKIDVDTRSGTVTLNGPAPTQEAKDRATAIAQGVKGVNSVVNHLTVKAS